QDWSYSTVSRNKGQVDGDDYAMFKELLLTGDRDTAPQWRFGRYIHPSMPRAVLRQTEEGRQHLLENVGTFKDGLSHERMSDIAPFVFWDGEWITYEPGKPQSY